MMNAAPAFVAATLAILACLSASAYALRGARDTTA